MNSIFHRVSIRKYQEKKIEQEKSINFLTFPTSPLTINLSFLSNQKRKIYYHNKKSITTSVNRSAGENDNTDLEQQPKNQCKQS
ncbi:MAG: hypothetical protein ACOCN3_13665 [Roseburia inulinivorans]